MGNVAKLAIPKIETYIQSAEYHKRHVRDLMITHVRELQDRLREKIIS